jgi:hypothetical protein
MKRLLILLPLLFWIACDEDAEDTLPTELVGTWYLMGGEAYMEMTTNSDQTMIDRFGPGIGSIEVEGAVNTSLTYMFLDEDYNNYYIVIANQFLDGPENFPIYYLMVSSYGGDLSTYFYAVESEDDYIFYFTDSLDLSYDPDSYAVTIVSTEFFGTDMYGVVDSSLSVILSGTIQANTIAIPANTPTQVDQSHYFDYMPEMTITLEADGSIVRTEAFDYYEEPETETYEGTWSVSGDQLIILEEHEGNGETEVDTTEFTFSLSGNTLSLMMEEDWCEPDEEYPMDQCLEEGAMEFGLSLGSLTNLVMVQIMNFSNTPPTLARAASRSSLKHLLQTKIPDRSHILYNPFQRTK